MALWYLDDVPRMAPYSLRHRNLGGLLYHSHHVVVVDYETRSNPLSWSVRIVCTVHILLRLHAFDGSRHLLVASLPPAGLLKLLTAICSWATVFSLLRVAPVALNMRTHEELEREVIARQAAERKLTDLNEQLEQRVQARVQELAIANAQLHEQRDVSAQRWPVSATA